MTLAPDFILKLGDVEFRSFEVPEQLPFGGEQSLAVHALPGGKKVVDALGWFPRPIGWTGRFQGPDATSRARALQDLAKSGKQVTLSWREFEYSVVVHTFEADFQRFYQIVYAITCEVIQDNSHAPILVTPPDLNEAMVGDASAAEGMGAQINDPLLQGNLVDVSSAINGVPDFTTASNLTGVLSSIQAARDRVTVLVGPPSSLLSGTPLGGVVTGVTGASLASGLITQAAAADSLWRLYAINSILSRMHRNVDSAGSSGAVLSLVGGDLYKVAADAYRDPSEWTTIARANGMVDPLIFDAQTVRVPTEPDRLGGVLVS